MPRKAKTKTCSYDSTLAQGGWVKALCIGVDEYQHLAALANCVRDARAIAQKVQDIHGSLAAAGPDQERQCKNPVSKLSLQQVLKTFLAGIVNAPPRVVLVYFAGHGIRTGDKIFLVPANATLEEGADLKQWCMSLDEVWELLKTELEDKIHVCDVLFLVILDTCQKLPYKLKKILTEESLEPDLRDRPKLWALCTAAARGQAAEDGDAGGHSPFNRELLSPQCGLFEQNVSIEHALNLVCGRLRARGQEPHVFNMNNLEAHLKSMCLYGPERLISEQHDVFICLREDEKGCVEHLAHVLQGRLMNEDIGRGGEKRKLRVFLKPHPGRGLIKHQVADALCSSQVVILLVSHSTWKGVGQMRKDCLSDDPLGVLLAQYEMTLELHEQGRVCVLPLLIGSESATGRRSFYQDFDEYDDEQMSSFWPIQEVSKVLRVESVVKSALDGLRSEFHVAQGLHDKELKVKALSILHSPDGQLVNAGRSVWQTLQAFRSRQHFSTLKIVGEENDAVNKVIKVIKDVIKLLVPPDIAGAPEPPRSCTSLALFGPHDQGNTSQHFVPVSETSPAGFQRSHDQSRSASSGVTITRAHTLFSPERDPGQFYLVHSRHLSATASDNRLSASGDATFSGRERPQDVSEGAAGSADTTTYQYEVVAYLKKRGLQRIAERLSDELSLEEIDDLDHVKEERLNKIEWLEDAPRKKLLKLCREVTARLMSADDNDLSADDTISQGAFTPLAHSEGSYDGEGFESDGEDVLIAARNGGDCAKFQEHMQFFIKSWRWHLETDPAQESSVLDDTLWTRCMFLWIRFAHDATLDQRLCDKWLHATTNSPNQDRLLSILTECLSDSGTTHPRWSPVESGQCRKQYAAGISFTDMVVRHALRRNETSRKDWTDIVVRGWFNNTHEPFSDFLIRANMFLNNPEHHINGMSIFEALVETQSYVVFTKMSGLAASLLFGYLEARKLDLDSAGGAARGGRTLLHGFTSFVSSEGHAFSLSRTGMHSLHVIVQGLQGMVHLAHTCWEMMGPVKTAQAFLLLQEDHTVELDTQDALFLSKQKDVPWEDGSSYEGRVAEERRMKVVRKIYKNDVSHGVIRNYLEALRERWGHYIDSATGERRRVDCQAVSLLLVKGKSLHDVCNSGGSTRQEDLICPIPQSIMQDPVKCSDGHTDERKHIEEHFELALEKRSTPEEERSIRRSRLGHDARDGDSTGSKEGGKTDADVPFYTAEKFLEIFLKEIRLACLTGPPASGKTVTMQQLVCTHAATSFDNIHRRPQKDLALLPVFMRAAELPKLLSDNDKRVKTMKDLVELFVSANIHGGTFDVGVKNLILELLDHGQVLIYIDGLDEAAQYQDLVERIIDGAVKENRNLHILLSTREHSYGHSRGCRRLGAFDVVNLPPLDQDRQRAMIEDRLSKDKVGKFLEQLEAGAGKNPELATSPFLLSLIIEVYKEEGVIPTKRVELYDKQVKAIVSRCIHQRRLACIERDDEKGSLQILEKDLAADADALEVGTDYLGTLAFVCQMRLAKRDFTLAASLRYEQELWQDMLHIEQQHFNALAKINPRLRGRQQELLTLLYHTPDILTRARELMFGNPIVGLLTVVGDKVYTFSHSTLQEYLAARCTVSFFGHDAQELLKKLTTFTDSASPRPLNLLWNRMVLQFAACMLSEQVFEGFCQLVLASDDGTGSHCELVQDFLKERGASEKVEQMVCDRLQEIRDSERLITACKPLTIPDWSKAKTAESAMAIKELQSVVDDKNTSAADVWSRAKVARQERSGAATAPAARRGEHDTAVMAAPTAIYKHTKALADDVGIHRLRLAIVENPEGFFERAAAENLDNVTIEEFTRACTESVQDISRSAVASIFCELDTDNNGQFSMTELLQTTEMIRHFYKESKIEFVTFSVLMGLVHDFRSKRLPSDAGDDREQTLLDLAELPESVMRDALADKVPKALAEYGYVVKETILKSKKHGSQKEDQHAGKFDIDTATYGTVSAYHKGLDAIGTPHPNIFDEMKIETNDCKDSGANFEAWNSGLNLTKPRKEWDYVYEPFKKVCKDKPPSDWEQKHDGDWGGNRFPIRLQVFMHAHSAIPMSKPMGASLFGKDKPSQYGERSFFGDYKEAHEKWDVSDPRWLHPEEVSMVKVVILRFVKSQLDGVSLINALNKHDNLSGKYSVEQANIKANEIVKALDEGLREKDGSHSSCSHGFLVDALAHISTKEEVEAIIDHFHKKLADAELSEAEVIGLRVYSGPLYVKMNSSLRAVGAHVKMVVSLPCTPGKGIENVLEVFKSVVGVVAHVEPNKVSIDSVLELETSTLIEFRVGVSPKQEEAAQVLQRMTVGLGDINAGLAENNVLNISVVQVADIFAFPDHLQGNRYVNTIYACSSGMRKMSRVSRIPRGRRVYRGMGGVKFSKEFLMIREGGGSGGVDFGAHVLVCSCSCCAATWSDLPQLC
jgi:hypothetical protein